MEVLIHTATDIFLKIFMGLFTHLFPSNNRLKLSKIYFNGHISDRKCAKRDY